MAEYGEGSGAASHAMGGDLPSFDIDLFPTGDEASGFHTQNDPSSPYQRTNVIQRKGAVDIRCSCIDVMHGKFDGSSYGTLLVLQFRFDPRKRARRIASAYITLRFSGMEASVSRTEVCAISPDGRFNMVETTQHEEVTKGGEMKLGVSASQGLQADGGFKWEKTTSDAVTDATTVTGSIDLIGFSYGPNNCASWSLLENNTRKTGVPASVRVGVLLKRKNNEPFKCVVEIEAVADLRTGLESVFGFKPKDDPVLFNPLMKPTNNLMQYKTEDLGMFDLESVSDVTFVAMRGGVIKEK